MKKKVKETKKETVIVAPKATTFKTPIDPLLDKCIKGVIHEVARDFHAEAKEIIRLGSDDDRREFLRYYEEDNGNICCLVLDRIKRDLVAEGKMEHKTEDAFGKPFML